MLFQCIYTLFYAMLSNAYFLLDRLPWWAWLCWTALLIAANVLPLAAARKLSARHLRVCRHGVICLRTFFWSLPADIAVHIFLLCRFGWKTMGFSLLVCSIAGYGFEIYHDKAKDVLMSVLLLAMMVPFAVCPALISYALKALCPF